MSEFVYELPKNQMVLKCSFCGPSGLRRKRDATFTASWEHVTVQVLKGINVLLSAIFRVGYLILQTY